MTDRDILLQQLADDVKVLTEPRQHRQPHEIWTASRHRKIVAHVTVQPSLLDQLRRLAVDPGAAESAGRSVPRSRTPEGADAFELLVTVERGAATWLGFLTSPPTDSTTARRTTEGILRGLVGAAAGLDTTGHASLTRLAGDVHGWVTQAEVVTGWDDRAVTPYARCPHCNTLGSLRLKAGAEDRAWCTTCGSAWSTRDGTIGLLADHVRATRDTPQDASS